ncbi:MAG: hypothetical protein ACI8PT_003418, partial [Gammaproteobacteria bacterium]
MLLSGVLRRNFGKSSLECLPDSTRTSNCPQEREGVGYLSHEQLAGHALNDISKKR